MASPNLWPAAFSLYGPALAMLTGNFLSGTAYFVDSTSPAASNANAGTEPELPKATWTSAQAAASANDVIFCAPNHVETISVANTLATANVLTVGLGTASQRARFTSAVAGAMWTLTGAGQRFYNCYFPASTAATTARIAVSTATEVELYGCYFECGANDATNCVSIAAANCRLEACSFLSTASRPARAINITGAVSGCELRDILLDGGTYGWSNHAFDVTAAATRLRVENVRLANKSDFYITNTGTSYSMFGVRTLDNTGSRIVLAA